MTIASEQARKTRARWRPEVLDAPRRIQDARYRAHRTSQTTTTKPAPNSLLERPSAGFRDMRGTRSRECRWLSQNVAMEVLQLGAWCDLQTEAEHREELIAMGFPDKEVREATERLRRHASIRISEFAVLADGRRVTLHNERGYSGGSWSHLTLEGVRADVLTTVLPDDDDTGEEHPWEWLAELLTAHGVEVSPDRLRAVPYVVEYSDRLLARIGGGGSIP